MCSKAYIFNKMCIEYCISITILEGLQLKRLERQWKKETLIFLLAEAP